MQIKIPQLLANEIEAVASGYDLHMVLSDDGSYIVDIPDVRAFREALSQVGELAQDNLTYESEYLDAEERAHRKAVIKLVKQYLKKTAVTSAHQELAFSNNNLSDPTNPADEMEAMDGANEDKEEIVPPQKNQPVQPKPQNRNWRSAHVELTNGR